MIQPASPARDHRRSFRAAVHQFRKRRMSIAHHIRSNALDEPRATEFSLRDGGCPGLTEGSVFTCC
jgi:hypothetical protein